MRRYHVRGIHPLTLTLTLTQTYKPAWHSTHPIHSPIPSPSSHHTKRVDAVRYFYLYLYGGVYIDLDVMCIRPFEALSLQGGDAHFSYTDAAIYAHPVKCCLDDRTLCLNGTCVHQLRP